MAEGEKRVGRQEPTKSVVVPYTVTRGPEAVELYNKTGNTAQPWQKLLIYDMMAISPEDPQLWAHQKFGYSVPRRNGKSEDVLMRCLWGLDHGEHILYTAHRATTSHKVWERLERMVTDIDLPVKTSFKAFGKERIAIAEYADPETGEIRGGGLIEFRTRTQAGALGEGFDVVIIDEAQEYTSAQETALKYVVTDAANPQTIMLGTPPTSVSIGDVFPLYREKVLTGEGYESAWEEWAVTVQTDPEDIDSWYETNPALGYHLTERKIRSEIGPDVIDFNIQRLGLWIGHNQASAITAPEWDGCKVGRLPAFTGKIYVGVKFALDGGSVSMAVAVKCKTGGIFVEAIDCRPTRDGIDWIVTYLSRMQSLAGVAIDGKSGQAVLTEALKKAGIKKPKIPSTAEIIAANAAFEQAIFSREIKHKGQPALKRSVTNSRHRKIGASGFGYESTDEDIDVTLTDAALLAHWLCREGKGGKPRQRAST